jgi:hypothetical protein
MRWLQTTALVALLLLPSLAFADCQHDGKTESEGAVVKFDDGIARECVNSRWVKQSEVPDPSKIHIIDANYGLDTPPVTCDPTGTLRRDCEGKNECTFPITNDYMCGRDIYRGPAKRLIFHWQCGNAPATAVRENERPGGPSYRIECHH